MFHLCKVWRHATCSTITSRTRFPEESLPSPLIISSEIFIVDLARVSCVFMKLLYIYPLFFINYFESTSEITNFTCNTLLFVYYFVEIPYESAHADSAHSSCFIVLLILLRFQYSCVSHCSLPAPGSHLCSVQIYSAALTTNIISDNQQQHGFQRQ